MLLVLPLIITQHPGPTFRIKRSTTFIMVLNLLIFVHNYCQRIKWWIPLLILMFSFSALIYKEICKTLQTTNHLDIQSEFFYSLARLFERRAVKSAQHGISDSEF